MNKRLLFAGGLLAVLAAATYFFVLNRSNSTVDGRDRLLGFATQPERITRIEIESADGSRAYLERRPDSAFWQFNEFYLAREDATELLLQTLERMRIRKPVSLAHRAKIAQQIDSLGRQVRVFTDSRHEHAAASFKIYGTPHVGAGNFVQFAADPTTPYLVYIPGFDGELAIRMHTMTDRWRTHRIFGGSWSDIDSLQVVYNDRPERSYLVTQRDGEARFVATGLEDDVQRDNVESTLLAQEILKTAAAANIETFDSEYSKRDSLLSAGPPYATIAISSPVEVLNQQIAVYRMPITRRSKVGQSGDQIYDTDRYFATINDGRDFVVIQSFVFDKIFR